MEALLNVGLGLGLAAACGFRVFVPLLLLNLAARSGYVTVSGGFDWIDSTPALITLAVATALEIGAYYLPWLDNLLDTVATPAAVVAGVVVTASVITGIDPYLKWTLAVIAGGGIAGAIQATTVGARGASTLATAGLGNPLLATAEIGGSVGMAILALTLPVVAGMAAVVLLILAARRLRRRRAAVPA